MSQPFTVEDRAFLRTILDVPEDRNTWLIYADWLDDRGDPRAEFLRLMVARALMSDDDPARTETEERLKQLEAELNPQWMMMFDPALIRNCLPGFAGYTGCGQLWADLTATDVPDIRLCHVCRNAVIYCHTLDEARQYASCGQRVALSTRIPLDEMGRAPELQPPPVPADDGSDEFELTLDEFLDAEPPPPPARAPEPRRPWWKFW